MNPFYEKAQTLESLIMDWKTMAPKPYNKCEANPYTRTRVILMNGTEFEQNWFMHMFSRNCPDNEARRELALLRRLEKQQQMLISALKPTDETVLEHTIGYEQLAVDLTAQLAQHEPDMYVKNALDFALLEDFDHLYRYADLMSMDTGAKAENYVGRYTEIMPGRPTISHHRHPFDSVKYHIDNKTAELQTKLCVGIITAAEQQTMNYYMNVNGFYTNDRGRRLYQEIGMVEEQHVTHYGSLLDPKATWFENLVMRQYTECYLYYSCMQTETDENIKRIWQMLFEQEISHLHAAAKMLEKYEGKHWQSVVGSGEFPKPLMLTSNIDYVREVLSATVQNTACREGYVCVNDLEGSADFFRYQNTVNNDVKQVVSHTVIEDHIRKFGEDYRFETAKNPIEELRSRVKDNTDVGRTKTAILLRG